MYRTKERAEVGPGNRALGNGLLCSGKIVCFALPAIFGALSHLAGAETVSASASVRITLHIPPKVAVRPVMASGVITGQRLCMGQIPASNYDVVVVPRQAGQQDPHDGVRLQGQSGNFCLPPEVTATAANILIVAQ